MSTASERQRESSAESERNITPVAPVASERTTATIAAEEEKHAQTAAQHINSVAEASSLEDSIAKLVEGLKNRLTEALVGVSLPALTKQRLDGVFSSVTKDKAALAKAITANTPAANVPGNSRTT